MGHGVGTCRLIDFCVVASGQLTQSFREWLGEANDQMPLKSKSQASTGHICGLGRPFCEDGMTHGWWGQASGGRLLRSFDVLQTSVSPPPSWMSPSKMAAAEMMSYKTWGTFFDPYCSGGGRWRPFCFRSQFWMTWFPLPYPKLLVCDWNCWG